LAVWRSGQATALKAGDYRFTGAIAPAAVVEKIARGDVYFRVITIPEGLTIRQMAAIYEQAGFGPAKDFTAAAGDPSLASAFDPARGTSKGICSPTRTRFRGGRRRPASLGAW